jgi:hypothetical protein
MIKIKCDYLNGATAVPTDIIDRHLKLAPAASFKVLLFILRNPDSSVDAQQISCCTGLSISETADCLSYWESYGVIETDGEIDQALADSAKGNAKCVCTPQEEAPCTPVVEKQPRPVRTLPLKKPTQRDIAMRLSQEPELGVLYREAQEILGTFGYDTQALILMIYDHYGFPPEVIITLLQHQKCCGKTSSSAIKSRAEDWAKRGIDTLDEAEQELLALDKIQACFDAIKEATDIKTDAPTPRVHKFLREWVIDYGCSNELITFALAQTNNVFSDAGKLLKKWARSGITTPEQAAEREKKALPKTVEKSYDTENVGRSSVLDWARRYANNNEEEEQ